MLTEGFGQWSGDERFAPRRLVQYFVATETHGFHAGLCTEFNDAVMLTVVDQVHVCSLIWYTEDQFSCPYRLRCEAIFQ